MYGAARTSSTYRMDMTNMDEPAREPIRFRALTPRDAYHMKNRKSPRLMACSRSGGIMRVS